MAHPRSRKNIELTSRYRWTEHKTNTAHLGSIGAAEGGHCSTLIDTNLTVATIGLLSAVWQASVLIQPRSNYKSRFAFLPATGGRTGQAVQPELTWGNFHKSWAMGSVLKYYGERNTTQELLCDKWSLVEICHEHDRQEIAAGWPMQNLDKASATCSSQCCLRNRGAVWYGGLSQAAFRLIGNSCAAFLGLGCRGTFIGALLSSQLAGVDNTPKVAEKQRPKNM